jgi:hypothetical protein
MIRFRNEGQIIRFGLNLYPLSARGLFGFVLKIGQFRWYLRHQRGAGWINFCVWDGNAAGRIR